MKICERCDGEGGARGECPICDGAGFVSDVSVEIKKERFDVKVSPVNKNSKVKIYKKQQAKRVQKKDLEAKTKVEM